MTPSERLARLQGLNLIDRKQEAQRNALISEAVAFIILFAIVAIAYFTLTGVQS